ncbi:MAG: DUF3800 domain-containing protein [Lachnospiraceae bacterium]|nr:DUF3800 domain-containing protein [Lachnospiraceae bacterium]
MKEYFLFLDESKNTPPSVHFALGGYAVEKAVYEEKICPYIRKMKKDIFEDENVILHESELRIAKKEIYKIMRKPEKRELFWRSMGELFDENNITVFVAVINPNEYKIKYNSRFLNDEYFVCLEIIVENFVHFLEKHNAIGTIYLESQNPKADNRLTNYFQQLVKRGTRCMNNHAVRTQIATINFYQKSDLNIGLQIADFIPNTMKKYAHGIKNKRPSIECEIAKCLYDGQAGEVNTFGVKKV